MANGTLTAYVTTTTKESYVNVSCDVHHAMCCEPLGINDNERSIYLEDANDDKKLSLAGCDTGVLFHCKELMA